MSFLPSNIEISNDVLYILNSSDKKNRSNISKLGLQKIIYLANSFAAVKDIILSTIRFVIEKRGPYSKEIQNSVDQLVAFGFVDIDFQSNSNKKYSLANYSITDAGRIVVKNLLLLNKEKEKSWWLDLTTRLSIIYSEQLELDEKSSNKGLNNIVKLVYQDLSFIDAKENGYFRSSIDLKNKDSLSFNLVSFTKRIVESNEKLKNKNEYFIAEHVVITLFEFLYSKYIDSKNAG